MDGVASGVLAGAPRRQAPLQGGGGCYRLAGRPEREECASANVQPASNLSVQ